ncbi:glycosyltransferase family 4 protein [Azospirillum rugosum]|uniref:Glycosyltransferase involved in cell wall biosynthesis n=1 Tax=Azospirillum rugosum TaxID=416170 RepID=A0ABS4SQ93_9PROT|nr:glycosyltransferase family 4 protein [Azospirillum rugosum]MBP2294627.1 glycosyltransferase involved in cell wall biosynthesis [Azospirillum rugosum]MDQ0528084.1 glycosyltransferase involved in cell wall biosynthesis [Azospirillum rugosum]
MGYGSLPVRPSRVLMTADAVGGVWDYALELARGFARLGIATDLAVMGPAPDEGRTAAAARIPTLTLHHQPFKLEWMAEPEEDLHKAGDWLLALEKRLSPDVVHVNGFAAASLPFRAPVLCVGHSCVLSWWRAVHREDAPPDWLGYAGRVADGLRLADMVAAPTQAMLDALRWHYGPLPRARVIPNGRDPQHYRPLPKRPIILAAGRVWDKAKNIAMLDTVAGRLPWSVFVAGSTDGPDGQPKPLQHARALGQLPADQLARWFGRAAVFAHPARYEPFGLAPLEAGLSGCALVLGDIPTLRELWDGAALFVDPDNRTALARALTTLADNPARVKALGAAARKRAHEFTAVRMVRGTLDAYAELLSKAALKAAASAVP